jgi:hypothetical protein
LASVESPATPMSSITTAILAQMPLEKFCFTGWSLDWGSLFTWLRVENCREGKCEIPARPSAYTQSYCYFAWQIKGTVERAFARTKFAASPCCFHYTISRQPSFARMLLVYPAMPGWRNGIRGGLKIPCP